MGAPNIKNMTLRLAEDLKPAKDATKDSMRTGDMDAALEATTFGRYHLMVGCLGSLLNISVGLELSILGYVLPFAQCDLKIGPNEVGFINSLFIAGAISSALFWGLISDTFGRRRVMIFTLGVNGICSIFASWSYSYIMFGVLRFVNGFMCGGPSAIGPSYIGEFFPDRLRSRALCCVGFFWTLSWMMVPALSWLVIPADINFATSYITYTSWRFLVALIGIPSIITATLIWGFLAESPKYLFYQGREEEARKVLKLMFSKNTGRPQEAYPIVKIVEDMESDYSGNSSPDNSNQGNKIVMMISAMIQQIKQLFTKELLGRTALSASIFFTNFVGYYGLLLWLPELYNRFEDFYVQNPNGTAAVCELSYLRQNISLESEPDLEFIPRDCDDKTVNLAVFSNTFILGAASCVGNLLVVLISNKVEGRLLTAAFMGLGGLCVCSMYFIRSATQIVIANTLFGVCVNCTLIVITYVLVNLFPTSVRSMAVSFSVFCGRIGAVISNLLFGLLIDINCEIPLFASAAGLLVAALLCLLLPKEGKKSTE